MAQVIRRARVEDNLYVGNHAAAAELSFLGNADIGFIINLSSKKITEPVDGVKYFNFILSSNEMLDAEIPRMTDKLDRVADCLKGCIGRATLIMCDDGKNLCMLCVGYFLVKHRGAAYANMIERLETLYLDETQRAIEIAERRALEEDPNHVGKKVSAMSPENARAYWVDANTRRALLCLTNSSFRKAIRITGGEPQRKARIIGGRR